jgi:hypothetical protein
VAEEDARDRGQGPYEGVGQEPGGLALQELPRGQLPAQPRIQTMIDKILDTAFRLAAYGAVIAFLSAVT